MQKMSKAGEPVDELLDRRQREIRHVVVVVRVVHQLNVRLHLV